MRTLPNASSDDLDLTASLAAGDFPFTPIQMDDIDLSFLARIDPRYLITEKQTSSNCEDWFDSSTTVPDRTFLYTGESSDQGPCLLRHLIYDRRLGCFGDDRWLVWRVASQKESRYLTVFPNHHLDCHAAMYSQHEIEPLFAPFQNDLVDLYFTHVHPSYPLLGSRASFDKKRAEGILPASLLAVVYLHASKFWHVSSQRDIPLPDQRALQPYIVSCIAFESRTPNLAVIQAALLFMQLPARFNRAPNQPGIWAMTSLAVAMAQDIGLHVDPTSWNISAEERKNRRILWWAVFIHDKFMCHWLGRPSNIKWNDWKVEPLMLGDFADEDDRMGVNSVTWANAFIAMANLSLILSDLLDDFYGVRSNFQTMEGIFAIEKSKIIMERLRLWKENYCIGLGPNTRPYHYTVHIAALTVELSTQRAVLGSNIGFDQQSDLPNEILSSVTHHLFPILDTLIHQPMTGLWLNYNKGGLSMIGSLLISLVLASISDAALNERRTALFDFRSRLQLLVNEYTNSQCFEFAMLPLRKVNLIIEELFQNYDEESATGPTRSSYTMSPGEDVEQKLWASYRIAFP